MFDYRIAFNSPGYLALLALVPIVWWLGRKSLAGLGRGRRAFALILRTLLVLLVVMALAEIQLVRQSDRVAVLYLVDRSASVPHEKAGQIAQFIQRSAQKHANASREDQTGVIVFGREAAVESPPLPGNTHLGSRFESTVDPEATNLAAALRLAQAIFPADAARRVVVISDGNQNVGDAFEQAESLAELGVGIDVVPLERTSKQEVRVDKLTLPSDIRQGTPFEARVVLDTIAADPAAGPISGRLRVTRTASGQTENLLDQPVTLEPGKRVFSFHEEIKSPDFYTYAARFVPDDPNSDALVENNEATAFTHVRGRGQVLVIEDWQKAGQFEKLVELLQRQNLEVAVQPSNRLFASLAELQRYDLVILADVPRAGGNEADQLTQFSDDQIDMLVQNTQHMGSGLLMIGGPDSFGAGGWTNTALEKAMPVDFQVKNAKVLPRGALMLVLDSSGSMSGDKLELSKAAAIAAVKVLSNDDFVGVVCFDSDAHWIVPMTKIENPQAIARKIAQIAPGGGTNMEPGMYQGYQALRNVEAAVKHMIVLTDGQTHGANFTGMASKAHAEKITTSTVAIGSDSARQLLNSIASAGAGKFYTVDNPKTIPRIFMKEAMRVARPVIYEDAKGILPQRTASHEILDRVDGQLPPITGFVMTSPKDSPLVEVALESPRPTGNRNSLLASWQFGLGKAVAFTTDAGQRWTRTWPEWDGYEKLLTQMVRYTMRPTDEQGSLNVFTEVQDGAIQVVVTALDKQDQFLNFLDLSGTLLGPQMQPLDVPLKQTAPGRYVGRVPVHQSGSYFLSVSAPGSAPVRAGINVPYSAEFRDHESNAQLLRNLAALAPAGGAKGLVLDEPGGKAADQALATNVFRHDLKRATSRQDSWHLVALAAACLFLLDVFNRRVMVSFAWVSPLWQHVRGYLFKRETAPQPARSLERLQARKSQLDRELDERRAAARFEPETPVETSVEEVLAGAATEASAPKPASSSRSLAPQAEEEGYTARLLKAKQRAHRDRR